MRPLFFVFLLLLSAGSATANGAPFSFVAMGDMPYYTPADYGRFERLIERINQERPAFSIHVGDIKAGSTPCTDEAFSEVLKRFNTFDQPLFYTPGDNEWTDCHRKKAGKYNPRERLAKLRAMFFAEPISFGRYPRPYQRQADRSEHRQMVENATWSHENIRIATVHIENAEELDPEWLQGHEVVGLTAGTSTLPETIDAVHERLIGLAAGVQPSSP